MVAWVWNGLPRDGRYGTAGLYSYLPRQNGAHLRIVTVNGTYVYNLGSLMVDSSPCQT